TEDHYIDYLTRTDISNLMPVTIAAKLRKSNFLFLGYSLQDWNLRVILHRIWGERRLTYKSWTVQAEPDNLEKKFWMNRAVEIMDMKLEAYIPKLRETVTGKQGIR
ncbi:SIR2 family protein, partial [bacterium]|nr:SIR2 family protein [bacterium]